MKIVQRIEIKNYLGTESRFIDFSEKDDSVLIVGENAKGKTTIMRAIYFCLTGEDAFFGSTNLDSVIRDGANEMNINMEILSSDNSSLYYIELSKKLGKSLKIRVYENNELLNTSELIGDAKEVLSSLFGNPTSIRNTYFMFSSSDDDFVNATNGRRLEIITKSSNIFTEYEMISDSAKVMAGRKEDEKLRLQGEYDNESSNIASKEKLLIEKESFFKDVLGEVSETAFNKVLLNNDNKQDILKKIVNLLDEKVKIEGEVSNIKDIDVSSLKELLVKDDYNNEVNKGLIEQSNQKRNLLSEKMKEKEGYIRNMSSYKEMIAKIETNISNLSRNLVSITDDIRNNSFDKNVNLEDVVSTIKNNNVKLEEIKANGVKLNTQIDSKKTDLNKTIELFNHSKECPICHSELTKKALEAYSEKINSEINELEGQRFNLRQNYSNLQNDTKSLELMYNNTILIQDNIKLENQIIELKKSLLDNQSKLGEFDNIINTIEGEIKSIELSVKEIESKKVSTLSSSERFQIQGKIDMVGNVDSKLERLSFIKTEIAKYGIDKSRNELLSEINELKAFNDNLKYKYGEYINITASLEEGKIKIQNILKQLELIKKDIEQYNNLRNYFGKNGIQKEQIEHILKSVEMETNGMINKFFDNIGVHFSYDGSGIGLEIIRQSFTDVGIETKSDVLKNFSDAQQETLKTLLKLSFSKVLQYLNGTPLNIIFLNETFNTLSVEKEEELVNILKYFAEEYHVFFITHNQSIISKYDNRSIVKL